MKEIFENLEARLTEIGLVFEKAKSNEMNTKMILNMTILF